MSAAFRFSRGVTRSLLESAAEFELLCGDSNYLASLYELVNCSDICLTFFVNGVGRIGRSLGLFFPNSLEGMLRSFEVCVNDI